MTRLLFCLMLLAPTLSFADTPSTHTLDGSQAIAQSNYLFGLDGVRLHEDLGTVIGKPSSSKLLAQAFPPATATPSEDEEPPPNVGELVSGAGQVIDDWKNLGWLAGVIALINLLLNTIRFTPVEYWLASLDYKWIKPLVATILGAALGGFSTFSTGAGILFSIIAGAMAGLTSVGFHELIDKTRKRTTRVRA